MAEPTSPPTNQPPAPPPSPPAPGPSPAPPAPTAGDTQAALEAARREAAESRVRIRELESQVAVSADAGKSELERASARAERAEKKLAGLELTVLRQGVAADKSVPLELLPAVAENRAELEAFADKLAAWGKGLVDAATAGARPTRSGVLDVSRGTPVSDKPDMNSFIREGFRR